MSLVEGGFLSLVEGGFLVLVLVLVLSLLLRLLLSFGVEDEFSFMVIDVFVDGVEDELEFEFGVIDFVELLEIDVELLGNILEGSILIDGLLMCDNLNNMK